MTKLSNTDKQFLALIDRSPDSPKGDGWKNVSKTLWPTVLQHIVPELVEKIDNKDGTGQVRLSKEGKIVFKYL